MTALIDTNILVYRYDPRFPDKQNIATRILRERLKDGSARLPHQALVEFVAATTRPLRGEPPLLDRSSAYREVEELLTEFPVLYPSDGVVRTAIRGAATYGLSWFDAHLWAYADFHGIAEILSEDFQNGRRYGQVKVTNPFLAS